MVTKNLGRLHCKMEALVVKTIGGLLILGHMLANCYVARFGGLWSSVPVVNIERCKHYPCQRSKFLYKVSSCC